MNLSKDLYDRAQKHETTSTIYEAVAYIINKKIQVIDDEVVEHFITLTEHSEDSSLNWISIFRKFDTKVNRIFIIQNEGTISFELFENILTESGDKINRELVSKLSKPYIDSSGKVDYIKFCLSFYK